MDTIVKRLIENKRLEFVKEDYEVTNRSRGQMENIINKLSDNYPEMVNNRLSRYYPDWNSLSDFSDAEIQEIYSDLYLNRTITYKGIFVPDPNGTRTGNLVGYRFEKGITPRGQFSHESLLRVAIKKLGNVNTYYAWVASIDPLSDNPTVTVDVQPFGTDELLPELEEFASHIFDQYWR